MINKKAHPPSPNLRCACNKKTKHHCPISVFDYNRPEQVYKLPNVINNSSIIQGHTQVEVF
ncbi:hypothetical protein WSO01_02120 [Weissella soli]|nr:hypothetical protein WSO01_02120 [Weissella soli]